MPDPRGRLRGGAWGAVADAGLSSLGNFAVGLLAVRVLDAGLLGAYALAYAAVHLAAVLPANLVLVPAEAEVVDLPAGDRLRMLRRTLRLGVPPALAGALLLCGWTLLAPPGIARADLLALTATAAAAAFASPLQDHLRRMLHAAGRSWRAAGVSLLLVLSAALAVLALHVAGVREAWVPLGALAAANLVSLLAALPGLRAELRSPAPLRLDPRRLRRGGRWLLWAGLLAPGTAFAVGVAVAHLAGSAAVGYAEAARVATQPVLVATMALSAVWGPRSMEAARRDDWGEADRVRRRTHAAVLAFTGAYLLAFGWAQPPNPLRLLVPAAFQVPGLVVLTGVALAANALLFPVRSELVARDQARALAARDTLASAARLLAGGLAAFAGAYAVPAGILVYALARWPGYLRLRAAVRRRPAAPRPVTGFHPLHQGSHA